jgi:hypothetical protein
VVGLSYDYVSFLLVGVTIYGIYNNVFYFNSQLQQDWIAAYGVRFFISFQNDLFHSNFRYHTISFDFNVFYIIFGSIKLTPTILATDSSHVE